MKHFFSTIFVLIAFGFGLTLHAQGLPDYVSSNGIVGWWPFTGNANDYSNNGFNGVVMGASLSKDRFNDDDKAYDFNNPTDHIALSQINNDMFSGEFAISLWVNIRNFDFDYPHILSGNNNFIAFHGHGPIYAPENNKIGFYATANNSSQIGLMVSPDTISTNIWHHLVINNTGPAIHMYIDNVLATTAIYSGILESGDTLFIGNFFMLNNNLSGKIDDLGIWSRALTTSEIANLYNGAVSGINNSNLFGGYRIFPKPASDILYIDGNFTERTASYQITDITGRVFQTGTIDKEAGKINIEGLTAGVYLLQLQDKTTHPLKIIKQ